MSEDSTTAQPKSPSPLPALEIMQKYFIENRSRLLDIAAYLDRIQRANFPEAAFEDPRIRCLLQGISELLKSDQNRTERVQKILSDLDFTPLDGSDLEKNARGAPRLSNSCC